MTGCDIASNPAPQLCSESAGEQYLTRLVLLHERVDLTLLGNI